MCTPRFYTVATANKGEAPGELYFSQGVAIHEETHLVFVRIGTMAALRYSLRRESSSVSWV